MKKLDASYNPIAQYIPESQDSAKMVVDGNNLPDVKLYVIQNKLK